MALVQAAGVERAEKRQVERVRLGDAAHLALEEEAVVAVAALPALLRLLGDGVEPLRDHVGDAVGLLGRAQELGIEGARDRRLLDDGARVARVQARR